MGRDGPTVQVREEMRLDSVCTADGEGGAHCLRKWGYRPTVSKNEEVWNHCASKGGNEAGQFVYSRWLWCYTLCK